MSWDPWTVYEQYVNSMWTVREQCFLSTAQWFYCSHAGKKKKTWKRRTETPLSALPKHTQYVVYTYLIHVLLLIIPLSYIWSQVTKFFFLMHFFIINWKKLQENTKNLRIRLYLNLLFNDHLPCRSYISSNYIYVYLVCNKTRVTYLYLYLYITKNWSLAFIAAILLLRHFIVMSFAT